MTLSNNVVTGGPSKVDKDRKYSTLEEFRARQLEDGLAGYTQDVRFVTNTEQDKAAIDASIKSAESKYQGVFSNCADAVSDGLKAAGLDPGYSNEWVPIGTGFARIEFLFPSPNARFKVIKNNNAKYIVPTNKKGDEEEEEDNPMNTWEDVWKKYYEWKRWLLQNK